MKPLIFFIQNKILDLTLLFMSKHRDKNFLYDSHQKRVIQAITQK